MSPADNKEFDWKEYIKVAEVLTGNAVHEMKECARRIAISRAYYGCFCLARDFAIKNDWIKNTNRGDMHRKLMALYKEVENRRYQEESLNKKQKLIGIYLKKLRFARNRADYDTIYPGEYDLKEDAEKAIAFSKTIENNLLELQENVS
ncbi:hypothetical protein [Fuchsiella alkaliacetigena]|uniref:hypothetical protein n=1 Tax=Fuchsiella alkaliacetigena TaxID=957042 RepID=UPI00200A862F|nr:hypothetical protein [Fuchsiella alkaliacetigena]MCK8823834.1 hypothetical protein [Fuchsiella alkaliacetigena]